MVVLSSVTVLLFLGFFSVFVTSSCFLLIQRCRFYSAATPACSACGSGKLSSSYSLSVCFLLAITLESSPIKVCFLTSPPAAGGEGFLGIASGALAGGENFSRLVPYGRCSKLSASNCINLLSRTECGETESFGFGTDRCSETCSRPMQTEDTTLTSYESGTFPFRRFPVHDSQRAR